jgi:hypothetical protein
MAEQRSEQERTQGEIKQMIREAFEEFIQAERGKSEPAYRTELQEERKRREGLESRLNQLVDENRKARAAAEEAERHGEIRAELQKAGVAKLDLAFRAVKDDIVRTEDGSLRSRGPEAQPLQEYLTSFIQQNPELLPARIAGGSGAQKPNRSSYSDDHPAVALDNIRPGMNKEDLERARQHIAKLALQALRGS